MRNKKIYIKSWLELKPYEKQTITDAYYLDLSNKINKVLINNHFDVLQMYFKDKDVNAISCFIASYFEDIISETNIFTSFVEFHKNLYDKELPFYDTKKYYEEEINEQDVTFLFWYFFNSYQTERFIFPNNSFFSEMASSIMEILDEEYEYAPENELLKQYYQIDNDEQIFYVARNLIDTIFFKTYLFYPDIFLDLKETEREMAKEIKNKGRLIDFLNGNRDNILHRRHTRLLSINGKNWASKIVGEEPISSDFLNMSKKIEGYFLYKGQDDNDIFLEHISSGKKFKLIKESYQGYNNLKEIDTILFIGIVRWKNEWWFSGLSFQSDFNSDLVLEEKKSTESRMAVNFLEDNKKEVNKSLKLQLKTFKDFNNGSQIAFMESEKIEGFIKGYYDYFNNALNLTKKERQKAIESAKKDGYNTKKETNFDFTENSESGLVFFNPKRGVEVVIDLNRAFPLAENNYFNEEDSEEDFKQLLFDQSISTELVMFCLKKCKTKLHFLKQIRWKKILDNIDFSLRFWKKSDYHVESNITFINEKE